MEMDNEAYMKYLGLAALLGRLVRPRDQDDRESLAGAFADVNRALAARGSPRRFRVTHDGGYATFED